MERKVTPEMDELYKEMVEYSPFVAEFALRGEKMVAYISNTCLQEGEALTKQMERCQGNPNQRACIEGSGLLGLFESCYQQRGSEFAQKMMKVFEEDPYESARFCGASLVDSSEEASEHKRCIAGRGMDK